MSHARLNLVKGEVLGLIGENGAGKSTMMNILLGSLKPTSGKMFFKEKEYMPKSPSDALAAGISMIHQEVSLVPGMTVAENIWIGREKLFSSGGILNVRKRLEETKKIMDEPTSALADVEIHKLYNIIRKLSARGTAVIYISHKLEELFELCSRVTVFRDGKYIDTKRTEELDQKQLINLIVGRELKDMYPKEDVVLGDEIFSCKNLRREGSFSDISFTLRRGEILGFCGLMGAQRSEIMQSIFGLDPLD